MQRERESSEVRAPDSLTSMGRKTYTCLSAVLLFADTLLGGFAANPKLACFGSRQAFFFVCGWMSSSC
jgi:hypothetical protein